MKYEVYWEKRYYMCGNEVVEANSPEEAEAQVEADLCWLDSQLFEDAPNCTVHCEQALEEPA